MNRSKRLNTLRHLKVAFSEQVHLVQPTIFFFLLLDVLPDGSFIPAYRRNIVASCPELLTPEVSPSGQEITGDVDCTLPLTYTYPTTSETSYFGGMKTSICT